MKEMAKIAKAEEVEKLRQRLKEKQAAAQNNQIVKK